MPIDERSTSQYAWAVDLLIMLVEDDEDAIERYCDENEPEQIYADLEERGYRWTGDGWYTEEYIQSVKAEAKAQKSIPAQHRRKRRTKEDELELLRKWNTDSK